MHGDTKLVQGSFCGNANATSRESHLQMLEAPQGRAICRHHGREQK